MSIAAKKQSSLFHYWHERSMDEVLYFKISLKLELMYFHSFKPPDGFYLFRSLVEDNTYTFCQMPYLRFKDFIDKIPIMHTMLLSGESSRKIHMDFETTDSTKSYCSMMSGAEYLVDILPDEDKLRYYLEHYYESIEGNKYTTDIENEMEFSSAELLKLDELKARIERLCAAVSDKSDIK